MTFSDIATIILQRLKNEYKLKVKYPALGRADYSSESETSTAWIIRNIPQHSILRRNIVGDIVGTSEGPVLYLEDGEMVVQRDSRFGDFVITEGEGTVLIPMPNGRKNKIKLLTSATYNPVLASVDAKDGRIKIGSKQKRFKTLKEINDIESEIVSLEQRKKDAKEKAEIDKYRKEIEDKRIQLAELQKRVSEHVNRSNMLREQPILDKQQEKIKRSKILNGGLIINGGPGTGKTTSLIQRITFLTSQTIKDYKENLTTEDEELLFNEKKSWVFYSPSELLRSYLSEALNAEGLAATKEQVRVWNIQRTRLFKEFRLIQTDKDKPFIAFQTETNVFNTEKSHVKKLIKSFDTYFIMQQTIKLKKIIALDVKGHYWTGLATAIQQTVRQFIEKKQSFDEYIAFYTSLRLMYHNRITPINTAFDNALNTETAILLMKIESDLELSQWFKEILDSYKQAEVQNQDQEDDEPESETEEQLDIPKDFRSELTSKLGNWVRKYGLKKYDETVRLTDKEKNVISKIEQYLSEERVNQIGEGAYFRKYFNRIISGVEANLLNEFVPVYKKFRKEILAKSDLIVRKERDTLKTSIANKNNRLYRDEMDFILLQIFRWIYSIYRVSPSLYRESKHQYIVGYRESTRAIVAIDEASDFSLLQLLTISYLSHPRYRSVTLSGDIMQTMTSVGLTSWKDYQELLPDTELAHMKLSYRQTPVLLELAKKMHLETIGTKAPFESAHEYFENDPQPLLFKSKEFGKTSDWIADRIIDIYNIYKGKIPSIAVFLKDDEEVEKFNNILSTNDRLIDYDIKVTACLNGQILGDAENIRLFALKYVKGMEFQAVFFVNIDDLEAADNELLDKYIYVGLSRASFFLGITVKEEIPKSVRYLGKYLSTGEWKIV